ncbi:hypothetical protein SISSUDRAFT_241299 [Sistotremastrum suecicum HHB10207 ss-3]|uniref:Helicase C-terminal domain-containing protein n=1 Tax=Sistotremastrum suecicum HHB10207 ss-3 TaxID=1314776 RepID=A0A166GK48_9AGAM|nr:hypothetical protein SISSUDRAFT_241299 [Sistotremastrum suecicum HHB10207 ss-3]
MVASATKKLGKTQSRLTGFVTGAKSKPKEEVDSDEDNIDFNAKLKGSPEESSLPPINDLQAIFFDLISRLPKIKAVADHVKGRKLRVATMCSGTESPLLALGLSCRAIKEQYGIDLEIEHVFSCEIEPFKQAYIERNFRPPILFRDVCELGEGQATTAYGALVDVPGEVDILIAGTSCVDYSNLNNEKQTIEANGESGRTFRGMMSWVENHRPPIVILENVCSAPWNNIAGYFKDKDYSADHMRVDTKNYYIPHTRTRGYLIAVDKKNSSIPQKWKTMLKELERGASSTLDAFLLPSDDPRIHEAREKLVQETRNAGDRRAGRYDWTRCENRHQRARLEEQLGNKRPLTAWEDGGTCHMLDFTWADWGTMQVERVWDLMDITTLRFAVQGVDPAYKTHVWNLSQNVDRTTGSSRVGICPCLTPSMIPYVTNRGGPMVGVEALGMQGLPVEELLLTRETEDQLADLAGNAMSTTVVGTGILAALIVAMELLSPGPGDGASKDASGDITMADGDEDAAGSNKTPSDIPVEERVSGDELLTSKPLDLTTVSTAESFDDLRLAAARSIRLCDCEGRTQMTTRPIKQCKECGHTACKKCGGRPEHDAVELVFNEDNARITPATFAKRVKAALPMIVSLTDISEEHLESLRPSEYDGKNNTRWRLWKEAVVRASQEELRFRELKRQEIWVATYSSSAALLELSLWPSPGVPEWRLFAKPLDSEPANSDVRKLLAHPVARLKCENGDFLSGTWSLAMPFTDSTTVSIEGITPMVPSFEMRMGLQAPELKDKQVFSQIQVKLENQDDLKKLDADISGTYQLLEKCGTAMGALHKRKSDTSGLPMFFFLDPTRTGKPEDDPFVFSKDKRRLEFGETRDVVAKLDAQWRQSSPVTAVEDPSQLSVSIHTTCVWVPDSGIQLSSAPCEVPFFATPSGRLQARTAVNACQSANAMLVCNVQLQGPVGPEWPHDKWVEIDKIHQRSVFKSLTWLTERIRTMDDLVDQWTDCELPDDFSNCERCAPASPAVLWVRSGKSMKGLEDPQEASRYEHALKHRPSPFVTLLNYDSSNNLGMVRIGVNITSLVHRAVSRLPATNSKEDISVSWKLSTDFTPQVFIDLPKYELKSNRPDPLHAQPPHFKKKMGLRPEQLRSLHWMIHQESLDAPPFVEEEISEAILDVLGWRAQGRAQRPIRVRGGVLADQVGYGKTAITLGLIDCNEDTTKSKKKAFPGFIPVKATLVVVPSHLSGQWANEIKKFTGDHFNVVVIHTATQINQVTIEKIQDADIVIVASSLFRSDVYLSNLQDFAGSESLPNAEGRFFTAKLEEAHKSLRTQVELLYSEGATAVSTAIKTASKENAEAAHKAFVQTKRLKGKAYRELADALPKVSKASTAKPKPQKSSMIMEVVIEGPESRANATTSDKRAAQGVQPKGRPARTATYSKKRKSIVISDSDETEHSDFSAFEADDASDSPDGEVSDASASEDEPTVKSKGKTKGALKKPKASSDKSAQSTDVDEKSVDEAPTKSKNSLKRRQSEMSTSDVDEDEDEGDEDEDQPRKKKAKTEKVTKPKIRRADSDPWKLGSKAVRDDITQMHAPPLEMFHFHRLVIDEYTYMEGKILSVVNHLAASCRWILSGTPPTHDFAAVKTIAAFLGIHLGVDDDGEVQAAQLKKRRRDQTAAEKFHSFREVRSLEWHAHRHTVGQAFLDQFVRQNIAEIEEIPFVEKLKDIVLPAAERAIYLELEHHLRALDMTIKRTKKSESDREKRLNDSLGDSNSAEEALLKRCSHFDLQTTKENAMKACDAIVAERGRQLELCKKDLLAKLKKSVKDEDQIKRAAHGAPLETSLFKEFVNVNVHESPDDADATSIIKKLFEEADVKIPAVPLKNSNVTNRATSDVKKSAKGKGKADDGLSTKVKDMIWDHREQTHELRKLVKELVARVRSLRYFTLVRDLQKQADIPINIDCPACGKKGLPITDISLLSTCGHAGCSKCVKDFASEDVCVYAPSAQCKALGRTSSIIPGSSLGVDDEERDGRGRHFGSKLERIMDLIKNKIPSDERVLVFIQFDDLAKKVAEAFEVNKIKFLQIKGTASQKSKTLEQFQNDSPERVLLLRVTDESAAGANLTGANHAIFISPLLTTTQEIYDACETQAIGRLRRYGQLKEVKIYRFLSLDTIDVEIYEKRAGKKVIDEKVIDKKVPAS